MQKRQSFYTNLQFSLLILTILFLSYLALCPLAQAIHTPAVLISFSIIGILSFLIYTKAKKFQNDFSSKLKYFDIFTLKAMLDSDLDDASKDTLIQFLDRHYPQWKQTHKN